MDHKNGTKQERPNMRTIAERVELSQTAVSLALRGDESISPETRQRVLEVAEELNYEYVPRTRRSKPKRLRRLVFAIHDYGGQPATANPFYSHILSGAEEACREQHMLLSLVILQHTHPASEPLPSALLYDLDGILLTSPYPDEVVARLRKESQVPIVLVDNHFPGSVYDTVMADDFGGAYQATQHLISMGHQHIVFLTEKLGNPKIIPSFEQRYQGYQTACHEAGLSPQPPIMVPDDLENYIVSVVEQQSELDEWFSALISDNPHVTAFFAACDVLALGTIRSLQNIGLRIPDNFSVVGFDDNDTSKLITPPLTTVHSYKRIMAQLAVKRLLERIEGEDLPAQYLTVRTELMIRGSAGPPPSP